MFHFIKTTLVVLLLTASCSSSSDSPQPLTTTETVNSWSTKSVTMESGRKYFVRSPNCDGPCTVPRHLVIYTHGAGGPEDSLNVGLKLGKLHSFAPDVIFAYSISKDGTKKFDVGVNYCCTWVDTQEVQYLIDIRDSVSSTTPVDQSNVKLTGVSNGGMLSERGVCVRPDVFSAASSFAGTWESKYEGCNHGIVNIEQWHGTNDTTVPIGGGTKYLWGHTIVVPPADELGTKVLSESHFLLHIIEGEDHTASGATVREMTEWIAAQ